MRFERLGVFTYSPEEGTPSPAFADQVSAEVAAERASRVQELADTIAWERAAKHVGQVVDVLVDGPSEDKAFAWRAGRRARRPRSTASSTSRAAAISPPGGSPAYASPRSRDTSSSASAPSGHRPRLALAIATVGGVGYAPIAPGTAASAVTALILWLLAWPPLALTALLMVVLVVGTWASGVAEAALGTKDPGAIVVDEVAGMTISVLAVPLTPAVLVTASSSSGSSTS